MKVAITGASGLIGRHLVDRLRRRGDQVIALSRHPGEVCGVALTVWDPVNQPLPLNGDADAIVNLAGEGIGDHRWSEARKHAIRNSRILATRRCVEAAREGLALVSGSAVGYYGCTDHTLAEDAPPGRDFLAATCAAWEAEAQAGERRGARVVRLRTGIVLAADGGALPRLARLTRLGAGGPVGTGQQWWSWIHIADEVGVILHCLDNAGVRGPLNATAPSPARQQDVARELARVLGRPHIVRTPALALRLVMGEAADIVLTGQRVFPALAIASGYTFRFGELRSALRDLYGVN